MSMRKLRFPLYSLQHLIYGHQKTDSFTLLCATLNLWTSENGHFHSPLCNIQSIDTTKQTVQLSSLQHLIYGHLKMDSFSTLLFQISRAGSVYSSKKDQKSSTGSQSGSSHCSSCSSLSDSAQTKKIDLDGEHEINEVEVVYAKVCHFLVLCKSLAWVWDTIRNHSIRVPKNEFMGSQIDIFMMECFALLVLSCAAYQTEKMLVQNCHGGCGSIIMPQGHLLCWLM